MSRLPQVTARQMIAALKKEGFLVIRAKGSHHFLAHPDDSSRWATVAVHS
jgi:predicted RNA binding protein YcfA (HicA-like mRNA interferase family)